MKYNTPAPPPVALVARQNTQLSRGGHGRVVADTIWMKSQGKNRKSLLDISKSLFLVLGLAVKVGSDMDAVSSAPWNPRTKCPCWRHVGSEKLSFMLNWD